MPKTKLPKTVTVVLKKDYPIGAHIADAAKALVNACPEIFKKYEPYPNVSMVKYKEDEIIYEITQGTSRAKTGLV